MCQTFSVTSTTPLSDWLRTRHKAYCCYFFITIIICTYDELTADRLNACFLTTECHGDGKGANLCVLYFAHILDYTVRRTTTTISTTTTTAVKSVFVSESTTTSSPSVDMSTKTESTSKPGSKQSADLSELDSLHHAFLSKFVDWLFFICHFISSFVSVHSLFVVRLSCLGAFSS